MHIWRYREDGMPGEEMEAAPCLVPTHLCHVAVLELILYNKPETATILFS
jgi:hypothetical protein